MAPRPHRRELLLDAAIELVGVQGLTALTHRAVDAAAGVPTGTASNYWRTRQALLDALVDRVADRERDRWEQLTQATFPSTASELAGTLAVLARVATGPDRALVLARHALLLEAARHDVTVGPQSVDQDRLRGDVLAGPGEGAGVHLADGVGIGGELAAQDHRASLPRAVPFRALHQ